MKSEACQRMFCSTAEEVRDDDVGVGCSEASTV